MWNLREKRNEIYIYGLINPLNSQLFYVGASYQPDKRLLSHFYECGTGKQLHHAIIREIKSENKKPELLILEVCTFKQSSFFEEFYIQLFSSYGFKLTQSRKSTYCGGTDDHFYPKYSIQNTKQNTIIAKLESVVGGFHRVSKIEVASYEYNEAEIRKQLHIDYYAKQ